MKKDFKDGVSVIIPTFNRANYLYSTLICLCNQKICDGLKYEIVVVDSGVDETEKVVQMFQNNAKVHIVYKKIKRCRNRSFVRNTGAKLAKYNIFCFLDNDMLTPPDFIQRHYDEHKRQEHLVVMGCRRFLTEFDISAIGEETLRNNFGLLEKLPWYTDERLEMYEEREQWRFVFSHTLTVEADDFYVAGQFNVKFGEHWGFEDLDFGFNLMQNDCSFKLITDSFTYHQPHFSQSKKEQNETRYNKDLFLKIHNSYEVEMYTSFYIDYRKFEKSIKNAKRIFLRNLPTRYEERHFERILGYIQSFKEGKIDSKFQLGTYIPVLDNHCKNLLILESFFEFDRLLQVSILSEAFRVASQVYFRTLSDVQKSTLRKVAKDGGFSLFFEDQKGYSAVKKEKAFDSVYYVIIVPESYAPEKRYVYSYLAKKLAESGKRMIISDLHNNKSFSDDDLRLCDDTVLNLNNCFNNYFGSVKFQSVHSFSMVHSESVLGVPNNDGCFVLHDDDFLLESENLKYRGMSKSRHISDENFADLTFLSACDAVRHYNFHEKSIVSDSLICFMENGFLEDGIDLILQSFWGYKKKHQNALLTIKMPDYKSLLKNAYPLHNNVSKENKLFSVMQKFEADRAQLLQSIDFLGLEECVKIITKNCTMEDAVLLIDSHEKLVFASRGCYVSPQTYIALLLKKIVIIGSHHKIANKFRECCFVAESQKYNFSEELKVPRNCPNSVYSAFRCDIEKLKRCFEEAERIDVLEWSELYNQKMSELELQKKNFVLDVKI